MGAKRVRLVIGVLLCMAVIPVAVTVVNITWLREYPHWEIPIRKAHIQQAIDWWNSVTGMHVPAPDTEVVAAAAAPGPGNDSVAGFRTAAGGEADCPYPAPVFFHFRAGRRAARTVHAKLDLDLQTSGTGGQSFHLGGQFPAPDRAGLWLANFPAARAPDIALHEPAFVAHLTDSLLDCRP